MSFNIEDEYKHLPFFVKEENYKQWVMLFIQIETLLDDGNRVPNAMLKEFFSYMISDNIVSFKRIFSIAKPAIMKMLSLIDGVQDYDYSIDIVSDNGHITHKYSMVDLVQVSLNAYYQTINKKPELSNQKDETFSFFFNFFMSLKETYNPINQQNFSTYKVTVLAAHFVEAVGFKLTTIKNPTNAELYQACRYALKKTIAKQKNSSGKK